MGTEDKPCLLGRLGLFSGVTSLLSVRKATIQKSGTFTSFSTIPKQTWWRPQHHQHHGSLIVNRC